MTRSELNRTVTCPTCGAKPGELCHTVAPRKELRAGWRGTTLRNHSDRKACTCKVGFHHHGRCDYCDGSTEGM